MPVGMLLALLALNVVWSKTLCFMEHCIRLPVSHPSTVRRYVFNVGEGFQRFCVEHKVKLTKLTGILLTRTTSHAAGGLPGDPSIHAARRPQHT